MQPQTNNTKFAKCRVKAVAAALVKKLDAAREVVERGRMSRQKVQDVAREITGLLNPVPVPVLFHVSGLQELCNTLDTCAQLILQKPVSDVCAADVKEINDRIDEIIAKEAE